MKNKIMVISPHPDDETLGCGGTLLKFKRGGNKVFWLNFTDISEEYGYSAEDTRRRKGGIEKVIKMYPFDKFCNLNLKPTCLSEYPKGGIIDSVAKILNTLKPSIVILPFKNDAHSDHRVVFEIVYSCIKTFRAPFVKEVLMMEILSETEFASSDRGFVPNYFVDISGYLDKKIKIMQNYREELGAHPFPRSIDNIRALAMYRGATAGCHFAESFMLLKKIIR